MAGIALPSAQPRAPLANRGCQRTSQPRDGVRFLSTTPEVTGAGEHVTQPLPVARTASPDAPVIPGDQLFQRLLRHRIVFLGQQVDDDIANRICAEILLLSAEDEKRDITLYINSPGGSVYSRLAIYDVMQYVPNHVHTFPMGMAASIVQIRLTAGTAGQRRAASPPANAQAPHAGGVT